MGLLIGVDRGEVSRSFCYHAEILLSVIASDVIHTVEDIREKFSPKIHRGTFSKHTRAASDAVKWTTEFYGPNVSLIRPTRETLRSELAYKAREGGRRSH